jgi:PAS domain S-box-containing protein
MAGLGELLRLPDSHLKPDTIRDVAKAALLAAVYVVFARIGLGIQPVNAFATLVWPPSGIALAALLVLGYRFWPSIAIGAVVANVWNGAPIPVALGIGAGNALEALLGAWALRRIPGFRSTLDRLSDMLGLIVLAGALSTVVSATIGTSSLLFGGLLTPDRFGVTWRTWWLGDAIGDLIVAPLLLTWRPSRPVSRPRLLESAALGLLLCLASVWLFDRTRDGMASLLSPLLIWAAIRFDQRGAARGTFLVSAIAVWATVRGHGPFVRGTIPESLFAAQAFMALTAVTFLVLGAVMSERRRAQEDRQRAGEAIRDSELRYRTLTEAGDQMMWINDAEGRTTYVNRKVEELFGPQDLPRFTPAMDVIHPDDREPAAEVRRRAVAQGIPYRAEYRVRTKDGQYRWMLARVVPVRDAGGRVVSWIGSAADVHDLKGAHEELQRARDEAEAASRSKDQFLAALSHELRTPLTPVLAISSSLERNADLPAGTRKQIQIVRRNAELEARLIDDLLDLTRIAKGKLQLEVEPVDLAEALDDVVEICLPEMAAKGLVLEREGTGRATFVDADPARLRQILWNLVKNAIKFTPERGRISLRTAETGMGRIAIEVSDTGVGIEPSAIGRIFQPFEQADRRFGGLGLGLAISNALVEAQGGTLTAASGGPGRGATFRVELELSSGEPAPRAQGAPSEAASPAGTRHILLIEDHVDTLDAARDLLAELSYSVVTARTVEEALSAAESQGFDLVISDLGLPDGSGLDLMRRLRELHGLAGIAVTGYGMEEDVRRSREAGFVDHLVKPITYQRLEIAIEKFFAGRPPSDASA